MTNLLLLSDLHFEHRADKGRSFVDSLDPSGVDVLVLAGDIAGPKSIENALTMFSVRFPKAIILYVEGNHEYYDSNRQKVHENINSAVFGHLHDSTNNLHWLKNDVYRYFPGNILEFGGDSPTISKNSRRILGTTLWFPFVPSDYAKTWSDFAYIEDFFEKYFYDVNVDCWFGGEELNFQFERIGNKLKEEYLITVKQDSDVLFQSKILTQKMKVE